MKSLLRKKIRTNSRVSLHVERYKRNSFGTDNMWTPKVGQNRARGYAHPFSSSSSSCSLASSNVSRGATRIRDEDNIRGASRYRRGPKFRYGPTSKARHWFETASTCTSNRRCLSSPSLIGHRSALSVHVRDSSFYLK